MTDADVTSLLETVYHRFRYDFRNYAAGSLRRRLEEARSGVACASLRELEDRLVTDASAFPRFLRSLTVRVTELFRDPAYFATFRRDIVPILRTYPSLRIWIAGCSTGEEAFSFAIVLDEEGLLDRSIIYATDIDAESLRQADAGVYPLDRFATFASNHARSGARGALSDHFTSAYGAALFNRRLRRKIVFADHDLATDSCFAEMQLVSCRNVMIYFDRPLQERALGLFATSLGRRGFLGLGPRESLRFTSCEDGFVELTDRWYRRW